MVSLRFGEECDDFGGDWSTRSRRFVKVNKERPASPKVAIVDVGNNGLLLLTLPIPAECTLRSQERLGMIVEQDLREFLVSLLPFPWPRFLVLSTTT